MTNFDAMSGPFAAVSASSLLETRAVVALLDAEGRVLQWSTGAQALFGYALDDVFGRPLAELFTVDGTALRHRDGRPLDVQGYLSSLPSGEAQAGFLFTAVRRDGAEPPLDDQLRRWLFDQLPVPLSITDREGRTLLQNQAMAQAIHVREADTRGRRATEYLKGEEYAQAEARALRVAATGRPESDEFFVRLPGEPKAHAWAVDIFPLKNSAEQVHAVALAAYDYSELYGSRKRLALMSEARTRIGTSLDVAGTARELADVAVSRFADTVSVDVLDAVFQGDLPAPVMSGPVLLQRAAHLTASTHRTEHGPTPAHVQLHPASSPIARCLATGRAELHRITDPHIVQWLADDPGQAAQARTDGTHSLITVPIRARGTTLGVALFLRHGRSPEPFSADDLAVTEDLVARAAVCLDNARRFTRERGIALALQRTLLPHGPTTHPAVETAARYLPAGGEAEVGGDWFDVIPLPGARVGLIVGDVVGHGITASATMGRLRTAVRTLADIDLPPDELLTHLDDIVTHADGGATEGGDEGPDTIPGDVGATCLYAVYDPVSGSCSLARAGHPSPILVHPDGTTQIVDVPAGPPLGLGSLPFETTEVTLPEGSLLALFTDGLIEARDQDIDDRIDELRRTLASPVSSLEELCDITLGALHSDSSSRTDDIALLLARTRILDEHQVASWDLPNDPVVVGEMRKQVGEQLTAWGLEDTLFTTELVVSELVTNAIRYGSDPIRLRLIKDRSLICEVCDGSSTSPHLRRARLTDEGGRGLFLVAQLTQRWGARYSPTGKTIWAEQVIETP
ncbi:ATP-binding SpoIIE family protein phosphatase [Streptomyces sp. B21-083]|uniref:ATP-binding SpoIIE family protein phosphatase n=1 Tax=Streptomyces sp. B21-083 TaxID=3039410 RepID=UPI002FEEC86C